MAYGHNEWEQAFPWTKILEPYSDYLAAQLPATEELDVPHRFPPDFYEKICLLASGQPQ